MCLQSFYLWNAMYRIQMSRFRKRLDLKTFSFLFKFQKKVPDHYPWYYPPKENAQNSDFPGVFFDLSQSEQSSEIK